MSDSQTFKIAPVMLFYDALQKQVELVGVIFAEIMLTIFGVSVHCDSYIALHEFNSKHFKVHQY